MATMICNASSALSDCRPSRRGGSCAPREMTKKSRLRRHFFNIERRSARSTFTFVALLLLAACDRASTEPPQNARQKIWEDFSGEKAFAHVQAMVDFGPRPAGSEAIEKTRAYLTRQLELAGWKVERQGFTDDTPRGKVEFVNLLATFRKESAPSFLLCSHFDTKTFDNAQFVGANDGGSNTG